MEAPGVHETVPLFNPRTDKWGDHFSWDGYSITGPTPVGRATIDVLLLNHERRIKIRQAEALFDLFPPGDVEPSSYPSLSDAECMKRPDTSASPPETPLLALARSVFCPRPCGSTRRQRRRTTTKKGFRKPSVPRSPMHLRRTLHPVRRGGRENTGFLPPRPRRRVRPKLAQGQSREERH